MNRRRYSSSMPQIKDYGAKPLIVNIDGFAKLNQNYRTALWTGKDLHVTLMSIAIGADMRVEMHHDTDQFIRIESGYALAIMGKNKDALTYRQRVNSNYAVIVPAGTWHNIINVGNMPLKLYSIYAPPKHPFGTVDKTKEDEEEH